MGLDRLTDSQKDRKSDRQTFDIMLMTEIFTRYLYTYPQIQNFKFL